MSDILFKGGVSLSRTGSELAAPIMFIVRPLSAKRAMRYQIRQRKIVRQVHSNSAFGYAWYHLS